MGKRSKTAKIETRAIPITELYEFPDNPNEESAAVYNNLMLEIQEDGFDQPLVVIPRTNIEPNQPGYTVVSGNHRFKVLKQQQFSEVDCVVKDWDAETAKVKLIRRNMIHGELNNDKFTRIVDSLRTGYTQDQLSDLLGFTDVTSFAAHYQKHQEIKEPEKPHDTGKGDSVKIVEGLTTIVNKLLVEYGDTIPNSFMFFLQGGKIHIVVAANTQLRRAISKIANICVKEHTDINTILTGVLVSGLANKESADALTKLANVDQDVEEELKPVK